MISAMSVPAPVERALRSRSSCAAYSASDTPRAFGRQQASRHLGVEFEFDGPAFELGNSVESVTVDGVTGTVPSALSAA